MIGAVLGLCVWIQLTGTYWIDGSTNPSARSYRTLQEAFLELNRQGAQGEVRFRIVHPYSPDAEPNTIQVLGYTCQACTVHVEVDTPITIAKRPQALPWGWQFVLRIQGGVRNFFLHGKGNLRLQSLADTNAFTGVVGIVPRSGLPVSHIRIDSCILEGLSRQKTTIGLFIGDSLAALNRPVVSSVTDITISSCTIRAVQYGIVLLSPNWGSIQRVFISENYIGYPTATWSQADSAWGNGGQAIFMDRVTHSTLRSNRIEGAWENSIHNIVGIRLDYCNNVSLHGNWVKNLQNHSLDGYGVIGVRILREPRWGPAPLLLENNFFTTLRGGTDENLPTRSTYLTGGILLESTVPDTAVGCTLRHNTIHLHGQAVTQAPWAKDGFAAGVILGRNIRGGVVFTGNLIQNTLALRSLLTPDAKETFGIAFGEQPQNIHWHRFEFRQNYYYVRGFALERTALVRVGWGSAKRTFGSLESWYAFSGLDSASQVGTQSGAPFMSAEQPFLQASVPWEGINAGPTPSPVLKDIQGENRPTGGPDDPGSAPDIGADEVAGTVLRCPIPQVSPLSGSLTSGQAGAPITLSVSNPAQLSGRLTLLWRLENTPSWQTIPVVPSDFPLTLALPLPHQFPTRVEYRLAAAPLPGCPEPPDTSASLFIDISDRIGNRPERAIPLTFSTIDAETWEATYTDSLVGYGTTDIFSSAAPYPRASAAKDLFFRFTLPDCMDSLEAHLCGPATDFDTRLHLFTSLDTITDSDQGRSTCTTGGVIPAHTSRIIAIGALPRQIPREEDYTAPTRAQLPLGPGTSFLAVVEGELPLEEGRFTLQIRLYKRRLRKPDLGPDRTACLDPLGIRLSAHTPGAARYEWYLNGQLLPSYTDSVVRLPLGLGTHIIAVAAHKVPNQPCASPEVKRDTLALTVLPALNAQILYQGQPRGNRDTLRLPFGTHSLQASAQVSGTTFRWRLWDSRGFLLESFTGTTYTREWGMRGVYLVELETEGGVCRESDSTWVEIRPQEPSALGYAAYPLRLYPNPATSSITLEIPTPSEITYEIINCSGEIRLRGRSPSQRIHDIAFSLAAGVYWVRIEA
ncbi:MAG: T9SS type A sorting domain-containing protein, partial [Bacteroidia bacterium]|nr:T9SS type A sorting domain-containing protein [Bacteroidia bacterium]